MRDIKFRAWDKKEKIIINFDDDSYCLEIYGDGSWLILDDEWEGDDRYILMQYTGLKDKNGKEIYEGDIVKSGVFEFAIKYGEYKIYDPVVVDEWSWAIGFYCEGNEDMKKELRDPFGRYYSKNCYEVIGNIYENGLHTTPSPKV